MISRIVGFSAFVLMVALLLMHNTGTIKEQAEINGAQAQAIAQKEQAIEQARQMAAEADRKREAAEAQRLADLQLLAEAEKTAQESMSRINQLLAENSRLEHEVEEVREWRSLGHPDDVRRMRNAAITNGATGADHRDGDGLPVASGVAD
ncbi:hypothetical protein [uncultured Microbulbifer sp.]|uniref:hypothetical protein n=1 Tax=uncultured Microbulbifer sp. TaxID=348147 RepID=UPI0025DA8348|nr:hypothetical protein [uncultured Microbulbifer sp.]